MVAHAFHPAKTDAVPYSEIREIFYHASDFLDDSNPLVAQALVGMPLVSRSACTSIDRAMEWILSKQHVSLLKRVTHIMLICTANTTM